LELPKSVESSNLSLNKAVIRWMSAKTGLKIAQTEFLTASAAPGPGAFNSVFAASFRPVRAGVLPAAKSSRFSNSSSPQKNVLFVGYGLDELEVLEYVIGKARLTGEPGHREMRHFLLQGFFSHEHEVARSLVPYYRECGIELIPFLRDNLDWDQLIDVLEKLRAAPAGRTSSEGSVA
jgi:hypothetical protein